MWYQIKRTKGHAAAAHSKGDALQHAVAAGALSLVHEEGRPFGQMYGLHSSDHALKGANLLYPGFEACFRWDPRHT